MPDDKRGREKQAADEEKRQRRREIEEARTRGDEPEPVEDDPGEQLDALDAPLEEHDYPTTTDELVEAYGDYEIETQDGVTTLEEVLAGTDNQTYESADDIRNRLQGLVHR